MTTVVRKHGGLGKGLGALIPTEVEVIANQPSTISGRPVDVFFPPTTDEESRHKDDWAAASNSGRLGLRALRAGVKAHGSLTDLDNEELLPVDGAEFREIPIDQIRPNSWQPREVFAIHELDELSDSIKAVGLLQPVIVRQRDSGSYELILGERRWRAARQAGLSAIPAIVRQTDDSAMLRDALIENLHRVNLNPIEEAAAYRQLLDDFGCTQEQLSEKIARSRPQISNTLRLLKLPPLVQRRVINGTISAGHARALLRLESNTAIEQLAQRIVAEGLSVRTVEDIVGHVPTQNIPRTSRITTIDPVAEELASRLSSKFGTKVVVRFGKNAGRLILEFKNAEDFNRILSTIAPGEAGLVSD